MGRWHSLGVARLLPSEWPREATRLIVRQALAYIVMAIWRKHLRKTPWPYISSGAPFQLGISRIPRASSPGLCLAVASPERGINFPLQQSNHGGSNKSITGSARGKRGLGTWPNLRRVTRHGECNLLLPAPENGRWYCEQ